MESKELIYNCLKYIDNNLGENLCVTSIASFFGYSKYHFSRIFKHQTNVSVMEYVKTRRLIKASEAISRGERIIDIALCFGWQSHNGFTKAFKMKFGFTPSLLKIMILQINYFGGNDMNQVFFPHADIHSTKEQLFEILINILGKSEDSESLKQLEKIYQFACQCYAGKIRYSGDEYITHPLNVAIIIAQMEVNIDAVFAGLLCDVLIKTEVTVDELKSNIPDKVLSIVTNLKDFDFEHTNIDYGENTIIVKLAERLHNMRTVEYMDEKTKSVKAIETLDLFMPIARKAGNERLIEELNDLALKYV